MELEDVVQPVEGGLNMPIWRSYSISRIDDEMEEENIDVQQPHVVFQPGGLNAPVLQITDAAIVIDLTEIVAQNKDQNEWLKQCLTAVLQDDRWFSLNYRRAQLDDIWEPYKGLVTAKAECENTFLIEFDSQEGRDLVVEENPWSIKGAFMMLKPYCPLTVFPAFTVKRIPLWVQLHGIPKEILSAQKAVWLGSAAGVVRLVDWEEDSCSMRLRIMVRPDQPLVAAVGFLTGDETWVEFRYERVLIMCQKCGVIGHVKRNCRLSESELDDLIRSKLKEVYDRMQIGADAEEVDSCDQKMPYLVELHGATENCYGLRVGNWMNCWLGRICLEADLESEAIYSKDRCW